jgi:NADH:ubiquinone oxidoreductase subunit 4 (subunit M)
MSGLYTYLFYYFIASSLIRIGLVWISSTQEPVYKGEHRVRFTVNYGAYIDLLHIILALFCLQGPTEVVIKNMFFMGINFDIHWSYLTIAFLIFSFLILWLMMRFSVYYLHRDTYYYKFFTVIYILQISLCILVLNQEVESVFIGWELLGISSVLLIAFYEHRTSVLKNSLRILLIYKVSDLIFYSVLVYSMATGILEYNIIHQPIAIFFILLACLIKSSIFPLFWLPRAMEGPTPSSAIFYGGLATHIPILIFINTWQEYYFTQMPFITTCFILVITFSIIWSNLLCRQCSDIKNALAYATITQLGVIYLEILCGFETFAIFHCLIHGIYRAFQFLRTPSQLYFTQQMISNRSSHASNKGKIYQRIFSEKTQERLYIWVYNPLWFQRVLISAIESFMGLSASRVNRQSLIPYILYSLCLFLMVDAVAYYAFHQELSFLFSEVYLFICAYIFNVLAMLNKYHPRLFFVSLLGSITATFSSLAEVIYPQLTFLNIIYVGLIVYLLLSIYQNKPLQRNKVNYVGMAKKSSLYNIWVLIIGMAVIGAPGLGSFIIWERLGHLIITIRPSLIIDGFCILTLNMIVFFRFYYANYLGSANELEKYKTIERS